MQLEMFNRSVVEHAYLQPQILGDFVGFHMRRNIHADNLLQEIRKGPPSMHPHVQEYTPRTVGVVRQPRKPKQQSRNHSPEYVLDSRSAEI